jgi:hypothetical protein
MNISDLEYNREGQLSSDQRLRLKWGIIIRGSIGISPFILLSAMIILFLIPTKYLPNNISWAIYCAVVLLFVFPMSIPAIRHALRLRSDLQENRVAEC